MGSEILRCVDILTERGCQDIQVLRHGYEYHVCDGYLIKFKIKNNVVIWENKLL